MRTVSFDIPPQQILTKESKSESSVTTAVDAVVYYKITDAIGMFQNKRKDLLVL